MLFDLVAAPNVDDDGYHVYPILAINAAGRGAYGNTLRFRFSSNILRDKDNDFKNYVFEVLDSDGGLSKVESHQVCLYPDALDGSTALNIDSVVNDPSSGSTRFEVTPLDDNIEAVYNLYKEKAGDNAVDYAEFDMIWGKTKITNVPLTGYSIESGSIGLDKVDGLVLSNGDDGAFSTTAPVATKTVADNVAKLALTTTDVALYDIVKLEDSGLMYKLTDVTNIENENGWTLITYDRKAAIDAEYIRAFSGESPYDTAILSKRRTPVELIFDANYSAEVKMALLNLVINKRTDTRVFIDGGILNTTAQAIAWAESMASIGTYNISKECQHYKMRDPFNSKTITVTTTAFLADELPTHYMTYGNHIPFVGSIYSTLTGYIKNSVKPIVDADDYDTKESLYTNRVNFFETIAEDSYIRGVQGTADPDWSDLSEENNVNVLLEMKRKLEDLVVSLTYNFANAEERMEFTDRAKRMFESYSGRKVRSFDVSFAMSEYEVERSILHCYLSVVFRTMAKRGIIEIDINKRAD